MTATTERPTRVECWWHTPDGRRARLCYARTRSGRHEVRLAGGGLEGGVERFDVVEAARVAWVRYCKELRSLGFEPGA